MSTPKGLVLLASAVVCSPVLWLVRDGSITLEEALQRWLICLVISWLAISVIASLAFPDATPVRPRAEDPAPAPVAPE